MVIHKWPLLVIFLIQVAIDWGYVWWIERLFEAQLSSWFLMVPIFAYFYFTFAFLSAVFIYQRKIIGLYLASAVLMFGVVVDVMTYSAVSHLGGMYQWLIIPIILLNCVVIFVIASNQCRFKQD